LDKFDNKEKIECFMSSFTDSSIALYLAVFVGPFIQEDGAVFIAASLFSQNPERYPLMFLIILFGLILSDIWKYWIGWYALKNAKVYSIINKEKITKLEKKVQKHTLTTLFLARFLPLARVPIYIACGLFQIPYAKFCIIIALTASIYSVIIFTLVYFLDSFLGEDLKWISLIIGLTIILIIISTQLTKKYLSARN
jgi:membrane protein DedA with SNARE-associated domain